MSGKKNRSAGLDISGEKSNTIRTTNIYVKCPQFPSMAPLTYGTPYINLNTHLNFAQITSIGENFKHPAGS
jgi:hypothetical protein